MFFCHQDRVRGAILDTRRTLDPRLAVRADGDLRVQVEVVGGSHGGGIAKPNDKPLSLGTRSAPTIRRVSGPVVLGRGAGRQEREHPDQEHQGTCSPVRGHARSSRQSSAEWGARQARSESAPPDRSSLR